jgi:hypothetical protein
MRNRIAPYRYLAGVAAWAVKINCGVEVMRVARRFPLVLGPPARRKHQFAERASNRPGHIGAHRLEAIPIYQTTDRVLRRFGVSEGEGVS